MATQMPNISDWIIGFAIRTVGMPWPGYHAKAALQTAVQFGLVSCRVQGIRAFAANVLPVASNPKSLGVAPSGPMGVTNLGIGSKPRGRCGTCRASCGDCKHRNKKLKVGPEPLGRDWKHDTTCKAKRDTSRTFQCPELRQTTYVHDRKNSSSRPENKLKIATKKKMAGQTSVDTHPA